MRNILIINGHPDKESYNYALSEAYKIGAKSSGAEVKVINIAWFFLMDLSEQLRVKKTPPHF